MKTCPFCAELIKEEAKKCKHCGEWLTIEGNNYNLIHSFDKTCTGTINENDICSKCKKTEKEIQKEIESRKFKKRVREIFPGVYLTTVSIIQGVALGILMTKTFSYINCASLGADWRIYLPYSILSFMSLIIVTYEYAWFICVFRASTRLPDIIIPFLLGVAEISPMFYLTTPKVWWFFYAANSLIGTIAFINTHIMCKKHISDIKVRRRTILTLRYDIIFLVLVVFISAIGGLAWLYQIEQILKLERFLCGVIFLLGVIILIKDQLSMNKIHEHFGVER